MDQNETLLSQVTRADSAVEDGEMPEETAGDEETQRKLRYYLKVMRLFEQANCPLTVIEIAEIALTNLDKTDPHSVSLLVL